MTASPQFTSTTILGIPLHLGRFADAVSLAEASIRERRPSTICHVDVHGIVRAQDDPIFAAALKGATLAATDGMPLVWIGRSRGHDAERVYGPDFMRAMLARMALPSDPPYRHFLYGSTPETLDRLTAQIARSYPRAVIAGAISPPFRALSDEEEQDYLRQMNEAGADIIWVGLGAPRQEIWMARNRPHLRAPLLVGVGAAFDFLAGVKPQAPIWIRSNGLEWAFRLVTEPRRLAGRYLSVIPRFLGLMALDALGRGK